MGRNLIAQIAKYVSSQKRRKVGYWVLCGLSAVVVFCTTYALILPAITVSNEVLCGMEAHTHSELCWTLQPAVPKVELICEDWKEADIVFHQHNGFCYDGEGQLICPLVEREMHVHGEECYIEQMELTCQEEGGDAPVPGESPEPVPEVIPEVVKPHVHTDACYTMEQGALICGQDEVEGHTHDDSCYILENTAQYYYTCGQEQTTDGHQHDETCLAVRLNPILTCTREEIEGHAHTDDCYEWESVLTCEETEEPAPFRPEEPVVTPEPAQPEEPHVHTDECYEITLLLDCQEGSAILHTHESECYDIVSVDDGQGGLEEREVLTCTLPVVIEHQHTDRCVQTVEGEDKEVMVRTCGLEEHVHTDACYMDLGTEPDPYICGLAEHQHDEDCWFEDGELRCTISEHTHTEECLDPNRAPDPEDPSDGDEDSQEAEYICGLEEHEHTEECFLDGVLTCEKEEHAHDEACLPEDETEPEEEEVVDWKCGMEEHVHEGPCYDEDGVLVCEQEEHIHSEACLTEGAASFILTAEAEGSDGVRVIVSGSVDILPCDPEGVTLTARQLSKDDPMAERAENLIRAAVVSADQTNPEEQEETPVTMTVEETLLFEISLWYDGEEIEPTGTLRLAFANLPGKMAGEEPVEVYHVDVETERTTAMGAEVDEDGNLALDTDHFSYYGVSTFELNDGWYDIVAKTSEFRDAIQAGVWKWRLAVGEGKNISFHPSNSWASSEPLNLPNATIILDLGGRTLTLFYQEEAAQGKTINLNGANFSIMNSKPDEGGTVEVSYDADLQTVLSHIAESEKVTVKLEADIELSQQVTINSGDVTLDLNGHALTLKTNGSAGIVVSGGAALTVTDSKSPADKEVSSTPATTYNEAGKTAAYESETLTYYITESEAAGGDGRTSETLKKHEVQFSSSGKIICESAATAIEIKSTSTMTLKSGLIWGNGDHGCLDADGGTLNLAGGYVVGSNRDDGAVMAKNGGVIELSGTVIAGNKRGINANNNSTLNMTGGVISGNSHSWGGGGIYGWGSTIKLSGGYLTNNVGGSSEGGGGLYTDGNETNRCTVILDGNIKITGNRAVNGGGGGMKLKRADCIISSPNCFISGNCSAVDEGGGIRIQTTSSCIITAGYVTNNATLTVEHWGGGGIFCADGWDGDPCPRLLVLDALITENEAGGFGGGVAGCSTGRLMITAKEGAAIYGNSADGKNLSGTQSSKNADHFAAEDEVFMSSGYEDYFCALSSVVEGGMLGGGSANWSGSVDGIAYSNINKGQTLEASQRMGLTANPGGQDIAQATKQARVFITGNHSNTHGGGILVNGYIVIGETNEFRIPKGVNFTMRKELLTNEGTMTPAKDAFSFKVTDVNGKEIRTVTNDEFGKIDFALSFNTDDLAGVKAGEEKDFIYFVSEVQPDQPEAGMIYDSNTYKIVVTVACQKEETITFEGETGEYKSVKVYKYWPKTVKVYKNSESDPFETRELDYYETGTRTVDLSETAKFINNKQNKGKTSVTVKKVWSDGAEKHSGDSVTVRLMKDGVYSGEEVTLSQQNGWTYIWDGLDVGHTYTVKEVKVPDGYEVSYRTEGDLQENGYFVPVGNGEELVVGGRYIIVSPDGSRALCTNSNNTNGVFTNADQSSVTRQREPLTIGNSTYSDWYSAEEILRSSIYEAQSVTNNKIGKADQISLKCITENSWLALEDNSNTRFKGTTDKYYSSHFWLVNGTLHGIEINRHHWDLTIQYTNNDGGKFSNSNGGNRGTGDPAKVYKFVNSYATDTTITITNTPEEDVPYTLDLTKTNDTTDPEKIRHLGGAEFKLYRSNEDGTILTDGDGNPVALKFVSNGGGSYAVAEDGTLDTVVTDQGGGLVISGIPGGTYILRETKAPLGYAVADDQKLTFNEKTPDHRMTYTVQDAPYQLPKTGGPSAMMYTTGGLLLCAAAGRLLYSNKSKRKGADDRG